MSWGGKALNKNILCIDGGGLKGIFVASLLSKIEDIYGIKIVDYFDMIAGTSTGGIIAAALSVGIPAKCIEGLYINNAKKIFPNKLHNNFFRVWKGKYKSEPLYAALNEVFGDLCIGDCKTRLLIPSFCIDRNAPQIFKTSHSSDLKVDFQMKLVDALMCTTAAPTYFNPYSSERGIYIDGGIGANNPSSIAVIEGITKCGWNIENMQLLSIGCTKNIYKSISGKEKMGIVNISKLINVFMEAESQYSYNIAHLLLSNRIMRINPCISQKKVRLDSSDNDSVTYLCRYGKQIAQEKSKEIEEMFLQTEKEEFIAFYKR